MPSSTTFRKNHTVSATERMLAPGPGRDDDPVFWRKKSGGEKNLKITKSPNTQRDTLEECREGNSSKENARYGADSNGPVTRGRLKVRSTVTSTATRRNRWGRDGSGTPRQRRPGPGSGRRDISKGPEYYTGERQLADWRRRPDVIMATITFVRSWQ